MGTVVSMLEDIQRLRYDVYCLEEEFEDHSRFPDRRERDEYDPYAVHLAATDERGHVAATLRLVLESPLGFPLERRAERLFPEFWCLPRDRTAEISRLIVARDHRHLAHDRFEYPPALFALFRRMYEESLDLGLEHWLALMEKKLWRLLRRFGFAFHEIGEPTSYGGEVIPYAADIDSLQTGYLKIVAYQRVYAAVRPGAYEYEALRAA